MKTKSLALLSLIACALSVAALPASARSRDDSGPADGDVTTGHSVPSRQNGVPTAQGGDRASVPGTSNRQTSAPANKSGSRAAVPERQFNGSYNRSGVRTVTSTVPGHYYGGSYNHGGGYYGGQYYAYRPRWNFGFGVYSWPWWGPHYNDYYTGYTPREMYSKHPIYLERPYYVSRSVEVDVQRALSHQGYYSGPVDGELGRNSRAAIRAYQANHSLAPSGQVDLPLLKSLRLL